ncbi:hypothetical protein K4F52_009481 [Lecanicillium sp. MT-2017a]|nr:hypothetical protein K4F52_009481 [Lecanicillium sp. MT-2017a]
MYGEEQTPGTRRRKQTEIVDFDLASVVINAQYVMPLSNGSTLEMILRRDERLARLAFTSMSHILKFQQCITGYKPWASYTQYNAVVDFVVGGLREPVTELACLQLWTPKFTAGAIVSSTDLPAEASDDPSLPPPTDRLAGRTTSTSHSVQGGTGVGSPVNDARRVSVHVSRQERRSSSSSSASRPFQSTQLPLPNLNPAIWSTPYWIGTQNQGQQRLRDSISVQPASPGGSEHTRNGAVHNTGTRSGGSGDRSQSVSSTVSNATSGVDTSSGSDGHSVTVSTGTYTTGLLHRRPPKPVLVIFTEGTGDQSRSIVTIQIDEETAINPERCDCRRAGKEGSACRVTAIEKLEGSEDLDARRYESRNAGEGASWNIVSLALDRHAPPDTTTSWPNLKRVSITFPQSEDRTRFGGTPNQCQCKIKTQGDLSRCFHLGHRGLCGEIREFYRKQRNDFHNARFEGQQQVVHGLMNS